MVRRDIGPLELIDDYFSQIPRTTLPRRAFTKHLQKVFYAIKAIEETDLDISSPAHENSSITECIYDFESQDLIESDDY